MTRSRRLLASVVGGAIGRSVGLIAPFLVMPIMLRYLGPVQFGIWMTAVSFTSMAQFADFGIGNGLLTRLSAAIGRDDIDDARTDISSAYAILIGLAFLLSASIAASLLALDAIHYRTSLSEPDAIAIFGVVLGVFFAGIPASVIQRVMYARQQVMLSNIWQIVAAFFAVVCCRAAIALHVQPWAAVLAYGLPSVLTLIVAALCYFLRNPEFRPRIREVRKDSSREIIALGSRFLVLGVMSSIAFNADNMILANNAGLNSVTEYSVPAKMGSLLGLIITTLFLPLWAANGEALARGEFAWVRANTWRMVRIGGCIVAASATVLTLASGWIIHQWMGRSFGNQQEIIGLLGGLSIAMAITSPYLMVLNSVKIIQPQIWANAAYLAISISLKLIFVTQEHLWTLPFISASVYMLTIFPMAFLSARAVLQGR